MLVNYFFNLCHEFSALKSLKLLCDLLYVLNLLDFLHELLDEVSVVPCPRGPFFREDVETLDGLLPALHLFALLLLYLALLLLLGFDLTLLGLLDGTVTILNLFPFLLLAVADLLLLTDLLSLLFLTLPSDSGVSLVGELDQLHDTRALLLDVLVSYLFVFLFHVSALVAVLSLAGVILVVLREISPRFEVVPILVEFVDLFNWS